jgi:hypothetical protein
MDYRKLNTETWKGLSKSGTVKAGYKTTCLAPDDQQQTSLHIFCDEQGAYHFGVVDKGIDKDDVEDPGVNGLFVSVNQYNILEDEIRLMIDLRCNMIGHLREFTELTREIAKNILESPEKPLHIINRVIRNWKTFWAGQNKQVLSEEEVTGLVCELKVLEQLCSINPLNALNSWTGPRGEKHDFNFSDWNFEVKGTRKGLHIHTINGIDQLRPAGNKSLAFISFFVSLADTSKAITLQSLIEQIINRYFLARPDLTVRFNELLARAGYSPLYIEEYRKFKIEVIEASLFKVDSAFPVLNPTLLKEPLSNRISNIRYDISLEGLTGTPLNKIDLGEYFY